MQKLHREGKEWVPQKVDNSKGYIALLLYCIGYFSSGPLLVDVAVGVDATVGVPCVFNVVLLLQCSG